MLLVVKMSEEPQTMKLIICICVIQLPEKLQLLEPCFLPASQQKIHNHTLSIPEHTYVDKPKSMSIVTMYFGIVENSRQEAGQAAFMVKWLTSSHCCVLFSLPPPDWLGPSLWHGSRY